METAGVLRTETTQITKELYVKSGRLRGCSATRTVAKETAEATLRVAD